MSIGLILGFFDGIHLGHQEVINSAQEYADEAILVTFKNSPSEYFSGNYEYIYPRKKSFSKLNGIKVVELDFKEIATMPAEDYLEYLVNEFHPVSISTGFNHTFGFNRSGDAKLLEACQKKYGYKYFCVPPKMYENEPISSTRIKSSLKEGDVEIANKMLGEAFSLEGKVIHGAKLGRKIGFPTANIKYPEHIVKLPFGVYGGRGKCRGKCRGKLRGKYKEGVNILSSHHVIARNVNDEAIYNDLMDCHVAPAPRNDNKLKSIMPNYNHNAYPAVINWGIKPTVNNTSEPVVEVHILGFEGDLYGQNIEIEILKKIRDEKKFENLEELKTQIKKDAEECLKL